MTPPISIPVSSIVSSAEANDALRTSSRLPDDAVDVEASRRQHHAGDGPRSLALADDDDRVGRIVGRIAVRLAERRGVSQRWIAGNDLVVDTEPAKMVDDLLLRIHEAWRTTTNDSS